MATSKKAAQKATEATEATLSPVEQIVTDHFLNGLSMDEAAPQLMAAGIGYSAIQATIKETGEKLGLYLSAQDVIDKVAVDLKGSAKPAHFFDLCDLVNGLNIPQADFTALLAASQLALKTNLTKSRRYVSLCKGDDVSTYAKIGKWAMENPDFTPSEMAAHDFGISEPLYVDDFLSYQKFFQDLEKRKQA